MAFSQIILWLQWRKRMETTGFINMNYRMRWFSKHLSEANLIQEKKKKEDSEGSQIEWLICGTSVDFCGLMASWALHVHSTIINTQSLYNNALYTIQSTFPCTLSFDSHNAHSGYLWLNVKIVTWYLDMLCEVRKNVEIPRSTVVKRKSLWINQTWFQIMVLLLTK